MWHTDIYDIWQNTHKIRYIFLNAERIVSLGVALENLGQRLFPKKKKKKPTHMSPISYNEGQSGSVVRDGPSKPARKIPFPSPIKGLKPVEKYKISTDHEKKSLMNL